MKNKRNFVVPYTPTPWCPDYIHWLLRIGRKSATVDCVCYEGEWEPEERDAGLMAAAPELLEALENLIPVAEDAMKEANRRGADYDVEARLRKAREACEKAMKEYVLR